MTTLGTTTLTPGTTIRATATGSTRRRLEGAYRWHRPLMVLAAVSAVLFLVCLVGMLVDDRVVTGVPIWDKPAKFAISIAVYAITMAWLIDVMPRHRRLASVLGSVIAVMLAGELVAILTQVVRGTSSHFNFDTPFDALVYQVMAGLVGTLWLCNLVIVVLLLIQRVPDRSLLWAMRLGLIIGVIGMGLAYLMTLPTPAQQDSWTGDSAVTVVGAHTVGLADGGPGLPILGWSTVGGDLRIPHFVGMHGLQVIILLALALTVLGRRWPVLAPESVRLRIVVVTSIAYLALLAVVTWQALRGQSIVHPDLATVAAATIVAGAAIAALAVVLTSARRAAHAKASA